MDDGISGSFRHTSSRTRKVFAKMVAALASSNNRTQWPRSFCNQSNRTCCYATKGVKPDFSIHGLWPTYQNADGPVDCDKNDTFNPALISDLRKRMEVRWPTLKCPKPTFKDEYFWEHEWFKHGTCSKSLFNQHDYFQKTLSLADGVDLLEILKVKGGIEPNGSYYRYTVVMKAITVGTGFIPRITCVKDKNGEAQLYEIYRCLDNSGSVFINCRKSLSLNARCPATFIFPLFEYSVLDLKNN